MFLARKYNFAVWQDHNFEVLVSKRNFAVLAKKYNFVVLAGNSILQFWLETHLCCFGRKTQFYGLSGKVRLSSFGGKTYICDFGRKIKFLVLLGNFDFLVLGKNTILRFWRKKRFFFVLTETQISGFDGKT